jgi:hypoxanthine phosphoribosyltransferase
VDDLADTGKTFLAVKKELEARGYEVDTAAIFHKANPGVETPTHCLFENYPPLWIVQPTEGHMEG